MIVGKGKLFLSINAFAEPTATEEFEYLGQKSANNFKFVGIV